MSNDIFELAKQLKQLAIDVKHARFDFVWLQTQIKDDWGQVSIPAKYFSALSNYHQIIRLCEAIEKLAEYENMEPVAWQFEWLDVSTGHWRFNISECKSDIDSIKYRVRNIIPLYRHPNK
ncbi:hypothetical protein [Xenorhabdus bovienii]|uniref:hypothetical protein n=1 Tax=Xenorhabdus bovienii TaxID=40576 RepID=UPI003DA68E15